MHVFVCPLGLAISLGIHVPVSMDYWGKLSGEETSLISIFPPFSPTLGIRTKCSEHPSPDTQGVSEIPSKGLLSSHIGDGATRDSGSLTPMA